MIEKQITIMGEKWIVRMGTEIEFPLLEKVDGYTDSSVRTIVVADMREHSGDPTAKDGLRDYGKSVLRHEVIHAFLYESGLDSCTVECKSWSQNEEMVDWIAIQFPKILKVFRELDLI